MVSRGGVGAGRGACPPQPSRPGVFPLRSQRTQHACVGRVVRKAPLVLASGAARAPLPGDLGSGLPCERRAPERCAGPGRAWQVPAFLSEHAVPVALREPGKGPRPGRPWRPWAAAAQRRRPLGEGGPQRRGTGRGRAGRQSPAPRRSSASRAGAWAFPSASVLLSLLEGEPSSFKLLGWRRWGGGRRAAPWPEMPVCLAPAPAFAGRGLRRPCVGQGPLLFCFVGHRRGGVAPVAPARGGVWVARPAGRARGGGAGVVWPCCRSPGTWRRGGSRVGCWALLPWVSALVGAGARVGHVTLPSPLYRAGERAVRRAGRVARTSRRHAQRHGRRGRHELGAASPSCGRATSGPSALASTCRPR